MDQDWIRFKITKLKFSILTADCGALWCWGGDWQLCAVTWLVIRYSCGNQSRCWGQGVDEEGKCNGNTANGSMQALKWKLMRSLIIPLLNLWDILMKNTYFFHLKFFQNSNLCSPSLIFIYFSLPRYIVHVLKYKSIGYQLLKFGYHCSRFQLIYESNACPLYWYFSFM